MINWTEKVIERLKALHAEGKTRGEIVRILTGELGVSVTRNVVSGKCHRLGLRLNPETREAYTVEPPQRRTPPPSDRQTRVLDSSFQWNTPRAMTQRRPAATIVDLDLNQCRWPVGKDEHGTFLFCGCRSVDHFPYCAAHVAKSYTRGKQW
jgi:hypothetical protein